ncbi:MULTISPECIES: ABC transporter ATP-binding protein [Cyanophyceae]|uniref:ABC transporter ATP-binding protein n=1 Tax=Cyanophyceae TaxID=3028117 RepID=UPI001689EC4F|nr:ABC transporter ATP-binding protein [Trichocoleus sp. FACHB-69]MBD1932282.1 ABC transporter ATP-binding protein [Trichocoleus sp. FACHB-69]
MTSKKLPGLAAFERTKNFTLQSLQQHEAEKTQGQISIRNVTIAFKRRHQKVTAVENVNLNVKPGEFVALLGASGCGKSTLLNAIAGIVKPTEGTVWIDNQQVVEPNPACGVVFQHHSLFPWMTVLQNVSFGPKMLGFKVPNLVGMQFLTLVGLEKFKNYYPSMLSGGMQQRVGIARALATQPPVLLMDEPFAALDAQTRSIMQEELLKIWTTFKTTVVFVTHDIDEAIFLSDRVCIMQSTPGSIKEEIFVDLDRPRTSEVMLTEQYIQVRKKVLSVIRQESLKSFNSQWH